MKLPTFPNFPRQHRDIPACLPYLKDANKGLENSSIKFIFKSKTETVFTNL